MLPFFRFSPFKLTGSLILFTASIAALAQTDTAKIQGTVTDSQGAVIPNATITATNTATGQTYTATSGGNGVYTIPAVVRGPYQAQISASGFKSDTESFELNISEQKTLSVSLQPGAATETIDVTAENTQLDTTSSATGEVIQGRQVTELPLNGRNFTQLALLTPGVTRGAYGNQASGTGNQADTFRYASSGGASLTVNGLRPQSNNFILDGVDNNEGLVNTINFFPPVEATQEFRVNTSVAPAEFGRAGGGIIQTSIKSGTNQIHGSAFDFLRNSVFDANDQYFNPITNGKPTPKVPFKRNQFGGTLGGAIWKNRLFLFGDYQGLRSNQPIGLQTTTVPTPLMRTGDFSELVGSGLTTAPAPYTGCNITAPVNGAIYNPQTCAPFPGNIIPAGIQNAAGIKYLNAFPAPTRGGIQNNYQNDPSKIQRFDDFDVRLDFNMTSHDTIFGRYSYGQDNESTGTTLTTLPSGFGSGSQVNHPRGIAVGETHVFGASVVNDFRYGYSRPYFSYLNPFNNVPLSANLGIANANRLPELGGGALIGPDDSSISYTGDGGPYIVPQKSNQFLDTVSYAHGNHSFRFGANILRREVDFFISDYRGKGFFQLGTGPFTGYTVSDLLDGFVKEYDISNPSNVKTKNWETGYFAQDDWRVTRRLTLNIGLRYDLFTNPTEDTNQWSNFDLASGQLIEAGKGGPNSSLIKTDKNNFAPRVGFAYDLFGTGKTVLRGGYGIFYFLDRGGVGNQLSQNPDFQAANSFQASNGYRITFTGSAPLNSNNPSAATGPVPLPSSNVNLTNPTNTQVIAQLPNNQTSSATQWNLQIEQQVNDVTSLSVAYVGNRSDHLMNWFNYTNAPQLAGAVVPFPGQGLSVVTGAATGTSKYNGLQVGVNRRMTAGLQYTLAYTWSHTLDNSSGPFSSTGNNNRVFVDGNQGGLLQYNFGNSDNDQRHAFTFATLYELPFGHGKRFGSNWNGLVDNTLGGWQFNLISSIGTGTPFDLTYFANCNGCQVRLDYNGGADNGSGHRVVINGTQYVTWINPGAFSKPAELPNGQFPALPTLSKNKFYGPGYNPVDLSIFKSFGITERLKMQLRAEAYNVFNTPQFTNPDVNFTDSNFGYINNTRQSSERELEFALKFIF